MEARAVNRYISTSPRKMRLVIDLIRGKRVNEALHTLHFSPKSASKVAEKVLRSAVANLQNKEDGHRVDPDHLVVKSAQVDGGMMMKRISAAPMGRAFRIRKRSNHITIVVETIEEKKPKAARQPKAAGKGAAAQKAAPAADKKAGAGSKSEQQ